MVLTGLSFGVQSFNDELLARIGRSHQVADVYTSIANAQQIGFSNISIDLIYALPGQTVEDFQDTLTKALALRSSALFRLFINCGAENCLL